MYKLIIEDDEGKTTVVPLIRDEITIGRKEGNTIRLTERNVSRRHAKLVRSNGTVFIEDLQSYNGIKVNGDKIAGKTSVSEGDRIQIGDYQLALKVDRQAAAPPEVRADEKTTPFQRDEQAAKAAAMTPAPAAGVHMTAQVDLPATVQQAALKVSPEAEKPARVVVVSSNFARQEFSLDKPLMVIGRTDDNDIVVNHRSISRHHAQIQREGTHFHVIDLQSANGVRVNGEEYGKVELRKGDMIDLGHVRLRFIAPGEDFVFDRDAKVVDVAAAAAQKGGGNGKLIAGIAAAVVLLVGGGIFVAKMMGNNGKGPEKGGDVDTQVAKLAFEADKAIAAMDWEAAIGKCNEALALDSKAEPLRQKKAQAEGERKNLATYEKYEKAVQAGDNDTAVTLYQQIPDESKYHEKAQPSFTPVKKAYIKDHLAKAKAALPSKCDEVHQHIDQVQMIDPGNAEAADIAKRCGTAVVKTPRPTPPPGGNTPSPGRPTTHENPPVAVHAPTPTHTPTPEPVRQPDPPPVHAPTPPPTPEPSSGAADAEKLLQQAQESYVHGSYQDAIEKARAANKIASSNKAWKIIGGSSCFQKNKQDAVAAWNRLVNDNQARQFLNYVCKRNGIDIP